MENNPENLSRSPLEKGGDGTSICVTPDVGANPKDRSKEREDEKQRESYTYEEDENQEEEEAGEQLRPSRRVRLHRRKSRIVGVQWLNFEYFKNRYTPDEGQHIIEVLVGHPLLSDEITQEYRRRRSQRLGQTGDTKLINKPKATHRPDREQTWIHRVRIQSIPIILLLARLSGHGRQWNSHNPHVFSRPFRSFYYFLPQMKQCLDILEERWGNHIGGNNADEEGDTARHNRDLDITREIDDSDSDDLIQVSTDSDLSGSTDDSSIDDKEMNPEEAVRGLADTFTALQHVRCFIKFVETEISPLWERATGTSHRKVRFEDLWMSFVPGELLVYDHAASDSLQRSVTTSISHRIHQKVWRLYSMATSALDASALWEPDSETQQYLDLLCYFIDYDGVSYLPVGRSYRIRSYKGEKDITALPLYPIRFLHDAGERMEELTKQGKRFKDLLQERHLYYDGWTLSNSLEGNFTQHSPPSPGPLRRPPPPPSFPQPPPPAYPPRHEYAGKTDSTKQIQSEYIEGDIIVDVLECFRTVPSLAPNMSMVMMTPNVPWPTGLDVLPIRRWKTRRRSSDLSYVEDVIIRDEPFGKYLQDSLIKEGQFLRPWDDKAWPQIEGEQLALLPHRVAGYALRQRKFFLLDTRFLRKIPTPDNAFRDLRIDPNHKRLVTSLVTTHFRREQVRRNKSRSIWGQDLIQGKGSGLVILLHGVPGVGKTATAEAVAQANNKPLFAITSGYLGFTPTDVEDNLRAIFHLAHLWDCVLLLDEADVFLSRREVTDLARNALVSGI